MSWKYRLFRLVWVDYLGGNGWELGIAYEPRTRFRSKDRPFRALSVILGRREYVFDLGRVK